MSVIGIRVADATTSQPPNPWVLTAGSWPPGPRGWQPVPTFEGPIWQAECLCLDGIRHDEVPSEEGTCGLYACTRAVIEVRKAVAAGVWEPVGLYEPQRGTRRPELIPGVAIVMVECLGRTVWHDNGVLRSARQVPLRIWLGPYHEEALEPLSERYQCPAGLLKPGRYLWSGLELLRQQSSSGAAI